MRADPKGMRRDAIVRAIAVIAALVGAAQTGPSAGAEPRPGTSILREASPGDRLDVSNYAGSVTVSAWDRNEVRVETNAAAEEILVNRSGSRMQVLPASWAKDAADFEVRLPDMARVRVVGKPPRPVDLDVRAPAWMPVAIEGPFIGVSVAGFESSIEVVVVRGRVSVRSSSGPISVVDMHGEILVEDTTGDLTLGGGETAITVRRGAGDLRAETTTGDVRLEELRAVRAEVTTVGGDVSWSGPLERDGFYDLSTHDGDISMRLPGRPDARFSARTYRGRIQANLEAQGGQPSDRLEITSGDGRASVKLVSFSGTIRLETEPPP